LSMSSAKSDDASKSDDDADKCHSLMSDVLRIASEK
jgi:hypothetical protein